ncbi:TetR/AcrR family transcriptional regulator [Cohnella silvisoli]|uniref:TetR/AcrR family transcriptional regulator n=1 Tax=Cohnella silvisoli TaxID=2873699 RepID=A0ABV1KRZ6_9BACL|nr:TetR/AcrR family transcriptional regulator [Cohnella silvisoli]MCD9022576.1 TetR family transcriptional regulator C-terminal domain-containing protein [Cohnella silvisoli]
MPKIVDHDKRKEKIAEATWRIIRRDGLDGVSVRGIADEMGISLGSLRHYFQSQDELLAYAMRLISRRAKTRIENLPFTGEARHDIEMVIAELAPLDEERLAEAQVWLAFAGKAISDSKIRALSREVHEELYAGFRSMIELLISQKLTIDGIDAEHETRRLHGLVDGLVVHYTTFPETLNKDELMSTVSYHLNQILINPKEK